MTAFEERPAGIVLEFQDGARYLYTHTSTGRMHVAAMKQLARDGQGLTTYVNQNIGGNYEMRLR